MKNLFVLSSFIFLIIFIPDVKGQEIWTLEKCIQTAIEKSINIQSADVNLRSTEVDYKQATHARYPDLSAVTNVGWNFGRTIDPTRNEFISETFFNNSFSLNSNVLLYNAGKINNSIKQADVYNKAALKDLEQSKRDISLSIASLYLNILFAKENLQNTQNQLDQTKNQLTLLNKQIAVGNRPENDRLDIEAQIAVNEQSVTEATNTLNINLLNLKQWLRLDVQNEIDVVAPLSLNIGTDPDVITFDELYESAYRNQASLHASELKVKGAELAQKIASADLMPVLSAGGYLRTNYSNKGVFISGYEPYIAEQEILFNGTSATIGIPQQKPILEKSPYFDQFSDNLSYGIGFSMSIPIYNNLRARSGVQRAKLNIEKAKLNYDQLDQNLKITIGQAHADAKAAKSRYLATEKTRTAQVNLYNNGVKKFEAGSTNVFELTRLKTVMDNAVISNLIAKYDYIFRSKVLDFYLGKPIKLVD